MLNMVVAGAVPDPILPRAPRLPLLTDLETGRPLTGPRRLGRKLLCQGLDLVPEAPESAREQQHVPRETDQHGHQSGEGHQTDG